MRPLLLAATLLAAAPLCAQPAPPTTARITDPATMIGGQPGADYFLADYTHIGAWLQRVAQESDRLKLVSIGKTSEGRDQWMAVISAPANLRALGRHKEIARRLALAKGLTDAEARALAQEGRAIVWIDAGVHATETVNGQAHIQIIRDLVTGNDSETLRLLGDDIALFVFANPDGLEQVAKWYMAPADPKQRRTDTIPTLYQKYVGHDDNRDSYASTQAEITNINKVMYREWFPQLNYDEHQTGPVGTVVFIPPFRDPYNYNNEPLVINETDSLAYAMHGRLIAEGKPGSVMRSGAPYSTWFNGGLRTIGYFHNVPGILTEIIGNPTPMEIPLVPRNQLAREDLAAPIAPQPWHFQQSIDYVRSMDRAVLDYASRNRETLLYNRYVMGRDQIAKGSRDSWIVTPRRIDALKAAAKDAAPPAKGTPLDGLTGYDSRETVPSALYAQVLHDPAARAPRAYILPADAQPDMPSTVAFLNALIKTGIEVQQAPAPFTHAGKTYPAGTYVVRTDQAFRPHVLDMFEPQDHPQDFAYPGGPPLRPYDITGYTLAFQMGAKFDRLVDAAPPPLPAVPDLIAAPPPGRIRGDGRAGYLVAHTTNNGFRLTNRLLKARLPVGWITAPVAIDGQRFAPGAVWIPASAKADAIVAAAVGPLGIDAWRVAAKPVGTTIALHPVRIGLVDLYGGSMASGWTRWIFEQFEFPYARVYPQELDRGRLNAKYDVLVFQGDVLGRPGRADKQPAAADIPAPYRPLLGTITDARTIPAIAAFAKAGGTVIAVADATALGPKLGVSVTNALTTEQAGKRVPLPSTLFYVPGSILSARFDPAAPLAFGMPATADVFYYNNPTYTLAAGDPALRRVAWFEGDDPLRSGWAWGAKALNGTTAIVDATLGKGHVYLLGPEVTQRAQPYSTFKLLFNGILLGAATRAGG